LSTGSWGDERGRLGFGGAFFKHGKGYLI
jgi:hypothetical protein